MQVLLRGKARAIYPLINKRWPSNAKYCNIQTYLVSCFWCISTVVFKTCRYLRTKFFRAQGSIRVNFLFHFRISHNGSFAARGKKSLPSILRARMKYCYSVSMIKVRTMVCRFKIKKSLKDRRAVPKKSPWINISSHITHRYVWQEKNNTVFVPATTRAINEINLDSIKMVLRAVD